MSPYTKKRRKQVIQVLLFVFVIIVTLECWTRFSTYYPSQPVEVSVPPSHKYITRYHDNTWKPQKVKKILMWTPFFGGWGWLEDAISVTANCSNICEVTRDRSELESSNAVLFHANDVWTQFGIVATIYNPLIEFPTYRDPSQVWVMWSMEPMCYMWGEIPPHTFNWTVLYRRDSTIYMPFSLGTYTRKSEQEIKAMPKPKSEANHFASKTKMAVIQVSNCKDQARRYRIIRELSKYIEVDEFGACSGNVICKKGIPTFECGQRYFKPYKFYLAFENTFCRDYLSEKYWYALNRHQIPVIAATEVTLEMAPPKSYLNVYDFPTIKDLADRMIEISNNETLFNSFFEWENYYNHGGEHPFCQLCQRLHEKQPAQSYFDIEGWISDDSCSKPTVSMIKHALLYSPFIVPRH